MHQDLEGHEHLHYSPTLILKGLVIIGRTDIDTMMMATMTLMMMIEQAPKMY